MSPNAVGGVPARGGVDSVVIGTLTTLIGWYTWAYLTYFLGSKFSPAPPRAGAADWITSCVVSLMVLTLRESKPKGVA